MDSKELMSVVEGLLFASGDEGITIKQISRILEIEEHSIENLLDELKKGYMQEERGMMIMQADHMYHLTTKPKHSNYFKKLLETPQTNKLSQAALETLAIIAYQQPITRVEIEEIRGVNSDRPVQTLVARSLVEEVGRKEAVGRPILFATNKDFLIYFGLTSLDELPPLLETLNEKDIEQEVDLFAEDNVNTNN